MSNYPGYDFEDDYASDLLDARADLHEEEELTLENYWALEGEGEEEEEEPLLDEFGNEREWCPMCGHDWVDEDLGMCLSCYTS